VINMDKFTLTWYGPFPVTELRKHIFEESIKDSLTDPNYSCFSKCGAYIFMDQSSRVLYVGQTRRKGNSLRTRIREYLKGEYELSHRLERNGIDIDSLSVIVAPVADDQAELYNNLQKIERILQLELNPPGNEDDMKIVNLGNIGSLPNKIDAGLSRMQKLSY